ncbi:hypothetical protein D9M70_578950 [compost metagenome]
MLVLLRRSGLLLLLEEVLAVIHDPANRWHGIGRDLYQIQLRFFSSAKRFINRDDANLLAVSTNQPHLASRNVLVDRGFRLSPLVLSHFTLNSDYSNSWRPRRETACASNSEKLSKGMEPRSTPSRVRTATDRVSTSRSPITKR